MKKEIIRGVAVLVVGVFLFGTQVLGEDCAYPQSSTTDRRI